jgi:hypothetical protein
MRRFKATYKVVVALTAEELLDAKSECSQFIIRPYQLKAMKGKAILESESLEVEDWGIDYESVEVSDED